ncbi:hypothetical protein PR202_gb29584 [Eleusine coracana subsp. coracana]|uniref:Uncharacterized protein n=1 Tax=Eleusine coracana subsp. coracana TaxID=191504 RepID=A0AAV5G0I5_ELECO|nr:hypothetical protein PR202_gb29584 [Eleusine coracana subsp. coracana]
MASLSVITPLDGGDGYLRWKETLLLHLNTVGVAHVLSEDPPPPALWEAVARTYDLAADCVSFRRFNRFEFDDDAPVLEQLAHVQELATFLREPRFSADFVARVIHGKLPAHKCFPAKKGESMTMHKLVLIAYAEALGLAGHATLDDGVVADVLCEKLPANVRDAAKLWSVEDGVTMENIWAIARAKEESRLQMEAVEAVLMDSSPENHE